jgi:hypothetical protein
MLCVYVVMLDTCFSDLVIVAIEVERKKKKKKTRKEMREGRKERNRQLEKREAE